jgi:hypothetical protein
MEDIYKTERGSDGRYHIVGREQFVSFKDPHTAIQVAVLMDIAYYEGKRTFQRDVLKLLGVDK